MVRFDNTYEMYWKFYTLDKELLVLMAMRQTRAAQRSRTIYDERIKRLKRRNAKLQRTVRFMIPLCVIFSAVSALSVILFYN